MMAGSEHGAAHRHRHEERARSAALARAFAKDFVDDLDSHPNLRGVHRRVKIIARQRGADPADLWVAVRDELRKR